MIGKRFNNNKPRYSLLDLECLEPCVRVLEYGQTKYGPGNWKLGLVEEEIVDSILRHLIALLQGEELDPESGISHIGHVQANALFLGNKANKKKAHAKAVSTQTLNGVCAPSTYQGE